MYVIIIYVLFSTLKSKTFTERNNGKFVNEEKNLMMCY